jgi:multiphosphoryl transfer protein
MTGIVIVSHSAELAEGLKTMALRVSKGKAPIAVAGGIDDPSNSYETNTRKILGAIESVHNDAGVIVFMDSSEAVLCAKTAIDLLDENIRSNVILSVAPLAEGVITAASSSAKGSSLQTILRELDQCMEAKRNHLGLKSSLPAKPSNSTIPGDQPETSDSTSSGGQPETQNPTTFGALAEIHNSTIPGDQPKRPYPITSNRSDGALNPLRGLPIVRGIAEGPVYLYETSLPEVPKKGRSLEELQQAIEDAHADLEALKQTSIRSIGQDEAAIFGAHQLILTDPELKQRVTDIMQNEQSGAAWAWRKAINDIATLYKNSTSDVLAERAADVLDAGRRVLSKLVVTHAGAVNPETPSILVTSELSPSDTASLDRNKVLGIVCERGSETSHSAILVRSLGIPTIFGATNARDKLPNANQVILDGETGEIHLDPDAHLTAIMRRKRDQWLGIQSEANRVKNQPVSTRKGEAIAVWANVSDMDHIALALDQGAEGIGLFRTEFLFMGRNAAPDEQEQYDVYSDVVRVMQKRPVTFRTIDIGGDKPVSYLSIDKEDNPFMGWRGIRFSLDREDLFRIQIRAMLRASAFGNVRIMFPMVSVVDEWRLARAIITEEMTGLNQQNIAFDPGVKLGIMVEVPSAAIMLNDFLEEVDFISIGTNDLTQYIMAADRTNNKVAGLAGYTQPAVLKMIRKIIKKAVKAGVEVSMCGEMARDTRMTDKLLSYGLRHFSMSAPGIPEFKLNLSGR